MKDQRPKNLNLFTIHFPLPAIVSILHRLSGVALFLLIPFLLWVLSRSLASEQDFEHIHAFLTQVWVKLLVWCILSAFIFHFIAGIRHLLMDAHIGETLKGGRISALVTAIVSGLFIIMIGIWIW